MSKWKKVGEKVAGFAPLIGGILGGPAGAAVGGLVSQALGVKNDPETVAMVLEDQGARQKIIELEIAQKTRFEELYWETLQVQTKETNTTMRTEVASEDEYVRHARPGFIYAMKWTWVLQIAASMVAALVSIFADALGDHIDSTAVIKAIAGFNADTAMQWSVALSVIGIYNVKRSHDKEVKETGQPLGGLLGSFLSKKS